MDHILFKVSGYVTKQTKKSLPLKIPWDALFGHPYLFQVLIEEAQKFPRAPDLRASLPCQETAAKAEATGSGWTENHPL